MSDANSETLSHEPSLTRSANHNNNLTLQSHSSLLIANMAHGSSYAVSSLFAMMTAFQPFHSPKVTVVSREEPDETRCVL